MVAKKEEDKAGDTGPAVEKSDAPTLYVDNKAVSEEAYLDAAEKAGYNRSYLVGNPGVRPAISTKKHGE